MTSTESSEKRTRLYASEKVYPYQLTDDGNFFVFKKMTPDRILVYHEGYNHVGRAGEDGTIIHDVFKDDEQRTQSYIYDPKNPNQNYVVITASSYPEVIGFFGFPVQGIQPKKTVFFSRLSPFPFFTNSYAAKLEASDILPDELTPKIQEIVLRFYRKEFKKLVDEALDELSGKIAGHPVIAPLASLRKETEPSDLKAQVGALMAAFFKSIDQIGTLPISSEELQEIRDPLIKFILYQCHPGEESSMIKAYQKVFTVPAEDGRPAYYEMSAQFRVYDGRIIRLWIQGPAERPEDLAKK